MLSPLTPDASLPSWLISAKIGTTEYKDSNGKYASSFADSLLQFKSSQISTQLRWRRQMRRMRRSRDDENHRKRH
eukprot:COSAG02_NODE_644_length_18993_cov_6.626389_2_plen_75_part_00